MNKRIKIKETINNSNKVYYTYSEYKQDDLPMGYPIELEQSLRHTNFKVKSYHRGATYSGLQISPTLESKPKEFFLK